MPPEITSLMPSSTVMSRWTRSLRGTNRRKPEVGFGVVGRKTLTNSSSADEGFSSWLEPVTKAIAPMPRRGYSTSTTSRNEREDCASTVTKICFSVL